MIKFFIISIILASLTLIGITYSQTYSNEQRIQSLAINNRQNEDKIDKVLDKLDKIHSCLEKLEDKMEK